MPERKSETVLMALMAALKAAKPAGARLERNTVLPQSVPGAGAMILRDGDPGQPEVTRAPLTYHYEHRAEVDVLIDRPPSARDMAFDTIVRAVDAALASDRTLGGHCDWAEGEAPAPLSKAIEGAEGLKAATITLVLHYATSDPLVRQKGNHPMARAQGARAQMALAFETTYGTPPASGYTRMPFATATLGGDQPRQNSELLGYGRDPLEPIKDALSVDGDIFILIDLRAIGFWLKAAFGDPVTTAVGDDFSHEFRSGSWDLPSMAIEIGMPEVPSYAMYSGCKLDQLSWSMQRSGRLTATARLVAQGEETS